MLVWCPPLLERYAAVIFLNAPTLPYPLRVGLSRLAFFGCWLLLLMLLGWCDDTQVCVMIHSGSRGLGHQVATDALVLMEAAMARDKIDINDRQLACAKISSQVRRACGVRFPLLRWEGTIAFLPGRARAFSQTFRNHSKR